MLNIQQASAVEFKYFHAHDQGKAAVRLFPGVAGCKTPRAGIHACGFVPGDTYTAEGAGAPVVLHYAACGLEAWTKK